MVSPALTRDYIYLPDGRMLAEADATGATVREYIWLGNLPIAIVNKAGATMTTYYVHAGHLNQPLVVTDGAKTKVWDATLEAFGAARLFTTTVEMNLRLPGQYFHAESALAQNWMRDYDPALGRYIQPDPIGLEGGPNVYGYVGQDPLNAVDPRGEDAWLVSRRLPGTHGSHMFVVVAPALGAPPEARFSYGPSGPMWNPGLLVPLTGGNNGTNRDDRDAWAALAGDVTPDLPPVRT